MLMVCGKMHACSLINLTPACSYSSSWSSGFTSWVGTEEAKYKRMFLIWKASACKYPFSSSFMNHLLKSNAVFTKENASLLKQRAPLAYHKALIKVPLKIVTIRKGTLLGVKKLLWTLGAPCLVRRLRIRAQLRPFQLELQRPSCNRPGWRYRIWNMLEVYALIVAAAVSKVEIIQQQSKNW